MLSLLNGAGFRKVSVVWGSLFNWIKVAICKWFFWELAKFRKDKGIGSPIFPEKNSQLVSGNEKAETKTLRLKFGRFVFGRLWAVKIVV